MNPTRFRSRSRVGWSFVVPTLTVLTFLPTSALLQNRPGTGVAAWAAGAAMPVRTSAAMPMVIARFMFLLCLAATGCDDVST